MCCATTGYRVAAEQENKRNGGAYRNQTDQRKIHERAGTDPERNCQREEVHRGPATAAGEPEQLQQPGVRLRLLQGNDA